LRDTHVGTRTATLASARDHQARIVPKLKLVDITHFYEIYKSATLRDFKRIFGDFNEF